MARRFLGIMTALVVACGAATAVQAAVDPPALCKDKKGKATGKKARDLFKAFGTNLKKPNTNKFSADISKAQSKFTKGFTKAEFTGLGANRGCQTINDADAIEAKVDSLVLDTIGTVNPVCGDNIKGTGEDCDGTDDAGCPGLCNLNCTCPQCGNLVVDGLEDCDSTPCCVPPNNPGECTFELNGASCGSGADTDCTNPDTCDGAGTCLANHESSGFACGNPADTDCTNPDTCNSSGTCLANHESSGFACGDPSDTECTDPDTCNGSGTCLANHAGAGAACGDQGIECVENDECDGAGSCQDNGFTTSGSACGSPANTECTNPDTCNGSGTCLANHETAGFACGDQGIECVENDECDGAGSCQDNGFTTAGGACGNPADTDCTNPDTCNGSGTCLANHESSGFACGDPSDTECTDPDTCNGSGTCLANHAGAGAACGDQGMECVEDDECDGAGTCQDNGFTTSGTPCDDGDACTSLDTCDGSGTCDGTAAANLEFVTAAPAGVCGRINDHPAGSGTNLNPFPTGSGPASLDCGTLYIGGGGSAQPPSPTPDGATTILKIDSCTAGSMTLAAATSTDTGSNLNCSAPGCRFGPPLPIPNPGATGVSTCVVNSIAASPAAGGTLDANTGASTQTLPLVVAVRVTGDLEPGNPGIQPCPTCQSGACQSGASSGGACTTTTSLLTSHDCLPSQSTLAPFGVDLSPLATGTSTLTATGGTFCTASTGQRTAGCFGTGSGVCEYIEENGSPSGDLTSGGPLSATLASTFCIPSSGDALINTVADLPGPGAVSLTGTADVTP